MKVELRAVDHAVFLLELGGPASKEYRCVRLRVEEAEAEHDEREDDEDVEDPAPRRRDANEATDDGPDNGTSEGAESCEARSLSLSGMQRGGDRDRKNSPKMEIPRARWAGLKRSLMTPPEFVKGEEPKKPGINES